MMKGKFMKIVNMLMIGVGCFLVIGTAGASDFYEECRAAADCVPVEPISLGQILVRCSIGIAMIVWGVLGETKPESQ